MSGDDPRNAALRIAFLTYRGKPTCGGQGVYTRHLTAGLADLGHHVEVFSGPPYPELDPRVRLNPMPSLDLYREPDPFRIPRPSEFRGRVDIAEFAMMCTAAFPEPLTFTWRVAKALDARRADFDLVHDNQSLGFGLLDIQRMGIPIVGCIHHPITVDRRLEVEHAPNARRRFTLKRWYAFVDMQTKVAQRLPRIVTVSSSSMTDIEADHGVPAERMRVVPVGVDQDVYRPLTHIAPVPGRLMTTASADVAMKGLIHLIEALAKVRTERHAELVIVGKSKPGGPVDRAIDRLGLRHAVTFVSGITDQRIVELYAEAQVAVVPSLYEGFSLPAIEAMSSGVALVGTTGGAIPEVVGSHGDTAMLVEPGDAGQLAQAIGRLLDDDALRSRIAAAGMARAKERYSWVAVARQTVEQYAEVIELHRSGSYESMTVPPATSSRSVHRFDGSFRSRLVGIGA
ncbi:MAG TPA: glycosyltransferase family 4 protein [Acidimicrobiales bacterium]